MPKFVVASYSSKGACHPVAMGRYPPLRWGQSRVNKINRCYADRSAC